MNKLSQIILRTSIAFVGIVLISSCGRDYTPEQELYIEKIEQSRIEKNNYMKNDPYSPFNYKGNIEFHELNYFDVDPDFVFKSKLYEYNPKDTVVIYGTKGEARTSVRYGYVIFNYLNQDYQINVYEGKARSGEVYYSIWFTDKTTNIQSYGVGRYIDFEKHPDPNYIYEVDFNTAYNPYCAYSPDYSCAIPTKEDFIPVEINAGEKKFHD